jgi:O-antigen ligase
MAALRFRLGALSDRELFVAASAAAVTLLLALGAAHQLGLAGLLLPVALVLLFIVTRRPVAMVGLLVGLAILCEGRSFGLFHFTSHLYDQVYKGLTPLDALVALTVASVGADMVRRRRPVSVPRPLAFPLLLLVLAMVAGAITGHAAGGSVRSVVFAENVLAYLLLLPIAISNLELSRRQLIRVVGGVTALAIVKAGLGLVEVIGRYGESIEGRATLSYYEPAANWLTMIALFSVLAMVLARAKPPRWALLGTPFLVASLLLSYRRSFWIAALLGLVLVVLLGTSPAGRRMLVPIGLLLAFAIWLLGSVGFQSSGSPVAHRIASLAPSKLEANVQDRYRLDERANVLGAIEQHPITGLGLTVPWAATYQPLSVEHSEGRMYVHFAPLWFWLKLGILGVLAYLAVLAGAAMLAWQAWRRSPEPVLRAFSLASLCGVGALAVLDTTASFTGVDPRFTVLFGAQLGLLGLVARTGTRPHSEGDSGRGLRQPTVR